MQGAPRCASRSLTENTNADRCSLILCSGRPSHHRMHLPCTRMAQCDYRRTTLRRGTVAPHATPPAHARTPAQCRQTNHTATHARTHAQRALFSCLYCRTVLHTGSSAQRAGMGRAGPARARTPSQDTVATPHGARHRRGRRHPAQSLISPSLSKMSPPSAFNKLSKSASTL